MKLIDGPAMLERLVAGVTAFVIASISAGGYAGIVALMAIESACIPLPSEIIMPFAGYLVYRGELSLPGVAFAGALGCVVGSLVAYAVGARGGRAAIEHWGRWVLLSPRELEIADRWFERWGRPTVFWARLLPVVRTFIALPAGIAKMDLWPFVWLTFVGSLPWCWALAYAGARLAENWADVREALHGFDVAIGALVALGLAWALWHRIRAITRPETHVTRSETHVPGRPDASAKR